jgi:hypothetical protein
MAFSGTYQLPWSGQLAKTLMDGSIRHARTGYIHSSESLTYLEIHDEYGTVTAEGPFTFTFEQSLKHIRAVCNSHDIAAPRVEEILDAHKSHKASIIYPLHEGETRSFVKVMFERNEAVARKIGENQDAEKDTEVYRVFQPDISAFTGDSEKIELFVMAGRTQFNLGNRINTFLTMKEAEAMAQRLLGSREKQMYSLEFNEPPVFFGQEYDDEGWRGSQVSLAHGWPKATKGCGDN